MSKIRRRNDGRSTSAAPHPAAALFLLLGAASKRRQVALRPGVQGGGLLVRHVPKVRPTHTPLLGKERPSPICDHERRTSRQEEDRDELKTENQRDIMKKKTETRPGTSRKSEEITSNFVFEFSFFSLVLFCVGRVGPLWRINARPSIT